MRHAKSSWDQDGIPDRDRPLSDRGRYVTVVLAQYAQARHIDPDLILCSSAVRTVATLQGVFPERDTSAQSSRLQVDDDLYTASAQEIVERLHGLADDVASVMVIGHNPAMQMLALKLAGSEASDRPPESEGLEAIRRKLPTGALVTLGFSGPWSDLSGGGAVLLSYVRPKVLLQRPRA